MKSIVSGSNISLVDLLEQLTKDELHEIRKELNIPNASQLNKAELAQRLADNIGVNVDLRLHKLDMKRFKAMEKVMRSKKLLKLEEVINIEEDVNPMYFSFMGLMFVDQADETVHMPQVIKDHLVHMDKASLDAILKRNTEWIELSKGLLYYYGVLDIHNLASLIAKYTNEEVDEIKLLDVLLNHTLYEYHIEFSSAGFSHYLVDDPSELAMQQKAREDLDYCPLMKTKVMQAADSNFVERNAYFNSLTKFIASNWDMDADMADLITEELAEDLLAGSTLNELLERLQQELEMPSMDKVNELMQLLVSFYNGSRQWILKGHAPDQLFQAEKTNLKPLPSHPFQFPSNNVYSMQTKQKIGRNDPCPCGSGKKYKKCCGN